METVVNLMVEHRPSSVWTASFAACVAARTGAELGSLFRVVLTLFRVRALACK